MSVYQKVGFPDMLPDGCFAGQLPRSHLVAFSRLSFGNGIAPNMSSVSAWGNNPTSRSEDILPGLCFPELPQDPCS